MPQSRNNLMSGRPCGNTGAGPYRREAGKQVIFFEPTGIPGPRILHERVRPERHTFEITHGYIEADHRMKELALDRLAPAQGCSSRFQSGDELLRFLAAL